MIWLSGWMAPWNGSLQRVHQPFSFKYGWLPRWLHSSCMKYYRWPKFYVFCRWLGNFSFWRVAMMASCKLQQQQPSMWSKHTSNMCIATSTYLVMALLLNKKFLFHSTICCNKEACFKFCTKIFLVALINPITRIQDVQRNAKPRKWKTTIYHVLTNIAYIITHLHEKLKSDWLKARVQLQCAYDYILCIVLKS